MCDIKRNIFPIDNMYIVNNLKFFMKYIDDSNHLDHFFQNDEFLKGLARIVAKRGLEIVSVGVPVHDYRLNKDGKIDKRKESWEIRKNSTALYKVDYETDDSHFESKTGRDYYNTRLLNLEGCVLLESEHYHTNTPECCSDDDSFPTPRKDGTYLYVGDELALELFRDMKAYVEMRKQRYKPAASAA
jgi:hypothetical protein